VNGAAIISATIGIKPRRMHHFLVGAPAGNRPARLSLAPTCKSIARSRRFLLDFTSEALQLSRLAKGDYIYRLLLADRGMAGMSSGRLAVAMSTPTVQPKTATVLLSQG
jgi:hypothetical protein